MIPRTLIKDVGSESVLNIHGLTLVKHPDEAGISDDYDDTNLWHSARSLGLENSLDEGQAIARSSYGDMLHDDERNLAYNESIRYSVKKLVDNATTKGQFFYCLDIGTGSGLLSMMIVRAFKEIDYENFHVIAFECFAPMAACAKQTIKRNAMSNYVTVVCENARYRRCNQVKFDLLVAELLDTELIGEGCIYDYNHAIEHYAKPDCIFIPQKATIYVEPISSNFLHSRNNLPAKQTLKYNDKHKVQVLVANRICDADCRGQLIVDDMQASRLIVGKDIHRFTEAKPVFEFDFSKPTPEKILDEPIETEFNLVSGGEVNEPIVICLWWSIQMYDLEQVPPDTNYWIQNDKSLALDVLSCAPVWARDSKMQSRDKVIERLYQRPIWREHWIQGIYYLRPKVSLELQSNLRVTKKLNLFSYRDAYTFWFDVGTENDAIGNKKALHCCCTLHWKFSRPRLSMLSTGDYLSKIYKGLSQFLATVKPTNPEGLNVLSVAQQTFFIDQILSQSPKVKCIYQTPGVVGRLEKYDGRAIVFCDLDKNCIRETTVPVKQISESNDNIITDHDEIIDCYVVDPYCGLEPWKAVQYLSKSLYFLANNDDICRSVFPSTMVVKCALVKFDNLHRMSLLVGQCEGFDMINLDKLIGSNIQLADQCVDTHYLWEYGCVRLSDDLQLFEINFGQAHKSKMQQKSSDEDDDDVGSMGSMMKMFEVKRPPNSFESSGFALAIWTEFQLINNGDSSNNATVISSGPMIDEDSKIGAEIAWSRHWQQGVHFLDNLSYLNVECKDDAQSTHWKLIASLRLKDARLKISQQTV